MAADDDDDMEWLEIKKIQHPLSDDEDAEYMFPEKEISSSERAPVWV